MGNLVIYQFFIVVFLSVIAFILKDLGVSISLLIGAGVYWVPSLIACFFLYALNRARVHVAVIIFTVEGVKVFLAILLMVFIFVTKADSIQWIYFFIGLISVTHTIFFVFWKRINDSRNNKYERR